MKPRTRDESTGESRDFPALWKRCANREGDWPALFGRVDPILRKTLIALGRSYSAELSCDLLDEVTQETWVRLLQNDRRVLRSCRGRTEGSIVTYLRRIARSTLIDWLRARRAMKRDWTTERTLDISDEAGREYFELEAKCPKPSPYDATHSRELRRRFRRECWTSANTRQTAARDAWITERMVVDGWSCREAATAVELAPATVSSVLTRMRRELRRRGLLVPARLNSRL